MARKNSGKNTRIYLGKKAFHLRRRDEKKILNHRVGPPSFPRAGKSLGRVEMSVWVKLCGLQSISNWIERLKMS